ncbi:hypothetical protein [Chitinimonas naiadis]
MNAKSQISAALISSRNILLEGHLNDSVLDCLKEVIENVDSISVTSTRRIIEFCVPEVVRQVEDANLVSAGMILNLIHNLPLDSADEQKWDLDYFLSMELSSFLENYDEIKSAQEVILHICGQLAAYKDRGRQ